MSVAAGCREATGQARSVSRVGALDLISDWPTDDAAAGVTSADDILEIAGDPERVYPWASVTKLLTAYVALMCVDTGIVDLEDAAGPEGATVRHLLAHASGLPFEDGPTQRPERRRVYSNVGFEQLADLLAERTGLPFPELLAENVLEPLGMSATELDGSPAAGARGSLADLLTLGREFLRPTLLSRQLWEEATSIQFEGLDGVLPGFGRQDENAWGLGLEIRDDKQPHWTGSRNSPATFGHFGQSGSFLWADPAAGLACAYLGADDFAAWHRERWPQLSDAVLDAYSP